MNILEIFKQSLDSLKSNKMRSFLTMIGISIGIAAVIMIVAIGNGGQAVITDEFEKIGANLIEIFPKRSNATEKDYLTIEDSDILAEYITEIKNITPLVQRYGSVKSGQDNHQAVIVGANSQLKTLYGIEMVDGNFYSSYDVKSQNKVAVISDFAAKKLFGNQNPIGKTFIYSNNNGNSKLKIVGINKELNPFAEMMGDEYPFMIFSPITTVNVISNNKYVDEIMATVIRSDILEDVGKKMVNILNFTRGTDDRYYAQNSAQMLEQINNALSVVTIIIGCSAGISLIVGGIGIMNIMLVSVKERTREIGIRKALGARNRDIIIQFLTEAVLMTVLSGLIGIMLGGVIAFIAAKIIKIALPISLTVGIGAFLFSALFGVFFGVYPAKKAADLDPIEALRYE